MGLPAALRSRLRPSSEKSAAVASSSASSPSSVTKEDAPPSPSSPQDADSQVNNDTDNDNDNVDAAAVRRATRMRKGFALSASFAYAVSWVLLLLVLVGNTSDRRVLRSTYFFRLDLADIIPTSVPNASLINSIAQSIGLHDFYQVGLWNFCEGYQNVGITFCSRPRTLYWFDPVTILTNELLSGATIALPSQIVTILTVLRIASQIMFGFFLTATLLAFVLIFLSPLAISSRWWSLPLAAASFLQMVIVLAASVVGTVISVAFKYAAEAQGELNIHVELGVKMWVLMWLGTGFSVWAFAVHSGMGCCCTSRRDLRIGRRVVKGGRGVRG